MDWTRLIDNTAKVFQIVAVIVGAFWVYFNALRGRTFVPRLQVEVSGKFFTKLSRRYLLVTMQVKNVGSSRVWIEQRGTGLKVNRLRPIYPSLERNELTRESTKVFKVLKRYTVDKKNALHVADILAVEPGAAHLEQKVIIISEEQYPDLELELRVVAKRQSWWVPQRLIEMQKIKELIGEKWKPRSWSAIAIPVEAKDHVSTSKS